MSSGSVTWAKDLFVIAELSQVSIQFFACIEETGRKRNVTPAVRFSNPIDNHKESVSSKGDTYDAGILSSTKRQDPEGGPVPRHRTFEGLDKTIRIASPPLSPERSKPSQLGPH